MKRMMKLLFVFIGPLMLVNIAKAEPLREQFKQMISQLQANPKDDALREKIIRQAQKLKPSPAIPEEAERFEGRAQFAFKNAKSPADYLDAAKEYEKAVAIAPWLPGYYADLCTIYEKAEKYAEAKNSCEFFLASAPSAQDSSDVRKRIAGLEYALEKANSPEVHAVKQKADEDSVLRSIDGARFRKVLDYGSAAIEVIFEVHGKTMVETHRLLSIDHSQFTTLDEMSSPGQVRQADRLSWRNGAFYHSDNSGSLVVSSDGSKLTMLHYSQTGGVDMKDESYALRQ